MNELLTKPEELRSYKDSFAKIVEELIKVKSVEHVGMKGRFVDVVKDVINLLPVYFISTQLVSVYLTRVLLHQLTEALV